MDDLFLRIANGLAPARVVWEDRWCTAVLARAWVRPGHTLVIAKQPASDWTVAAPGQVERLLDVARLVAEAQRAVWDPTRVGVSFTGLTFDQVHAHVVPLFDHGDLDLADVHQPTPFEADVAHRRLRAAVQLAHASSLLLTGPRAA